MKLLSLIFIFCLLVAGCKKYPEDEAFIHFKKPEKRMKYKSTWQITEYTINGADSMPHVDLSIQNSKLAEMEFVKEGDHFDTYWESGITLKFPSDKSKVTMKFAEGYPIRYPLLADGENDWDIIRFDKTAFIVQLNKGGKIYRIAFKRIRTQKKSVHF